jgi:AraC-like DNA-binding protein
MRFDENFYSQLNLSFLKRWEKFFVPRVSDKEDEVYNLLVNDEAKKNGYIFLHEDRERSFVIDRKLLPQDVLIIEPKQNIKDINFFDYLKIIENADQIHCIESSFAALIESLGLNSKPKFAHRYARPEAFYDYKHEFTYRTEWTIYR